MKFIQNLLFVLFLLIFVASCTEEEGDSVFFPVPTIEIPTDAPHIAAVGEPVSFTLNVSAQGGIASIVESRSDIGASVTKSSGFSSVNTDNYEFAFLPQQSDLGNIIEFTFTVTDNEGQSSSEIYRLEVVNAASEFREIKLGSFANSSLGSFFEIDEQAARNISFVNANSSEIDFAYSYGSTSAANIFALTDTVAENFFGGNGNTANWSNLRNTQLKLLSSTEGGSIYDSAVSEADIREAFDNGGDAVTRLTNIEAGDVFALKEDNGSDDTGFYVVKVTNIVIENAGNIEFSIKGVF